MLTQEDIKNLANHLVEVLKNIFVTKDEFNRLENKVDRLNTNMDNFAKGSLNQSQKISSLEHRMDKLEVHEKSIADAIDITLDF